MSSLIESCEVAPPPDTVADRCLRLTFLDIVWLHFHPIRRLLFFDFPCSKSYFADTLVPRLKRSLSLALKHYFPLAGNIVYPLHTDENKPMIRYVAGDSVPLTIFESVNDFDFLVGSQARDADAFYDYMPQLPRIITDKLKLLIKVFALQVTHFPGRGICIGLANDHAIGDASSIVGFIRSWASMCKLDGDYERGLEYSLPVLERDLIKDPLGLECIYWKQKREIPFKFSYNFPLPTNRVRSSYVLKQSEIKKLKDSVLAIFNGFSIHVSSFSVMTAYVWSCLAKALVGNDEEKIDDDEVFFFLFAVDIRARLDPPVPENYLGNCLSYGLAKIRHQELVGSEGFFKAAQAIGEEIKNRVNNKEKFMEGAEDRINLIQSIFGKRLVSVSGSTRVDLYGADFGLGRARKVETLSIDGQKYAISLYKSRDWEGGIEVGLSLPKVTMDVFDGLFSDGLCKVKNCRHVGNICL